MLALFLAIALLGTDSAYGPSTIDLTGVNHDNTDLGGSELYAETTGNYGSDYPSDWPDNIDFTGAKVDTVDLIGSTATTNSIIGLGPSRPSPSATPASPVPPSPSPPPTPKVNDWHTTDWWVYDPVDGEITGPNPDNPDVLANALAGYSSGTPLDFRTTEAKMAKARLVRDNPRSAKPLGAAAKAAIIGLTMSQPEFAILLVDDIGGSPRAADTIVGLTTSPPSPPTPPPSSASPPPPPSTYRPPKLPPLGSFWVGLGYGANATNGLGAFDALITKWAIGIMHQWHRGIINSANGINGLFDTANDLVTGLSMASSMALSMAAMAVAFYDKGWYLALTLAMAAILPAAMPCPPVLGIPYLSIVGAFVVLSWVTIVTVLLLMLARDWVRVMVWGTPIKIKKMATVGPLAEC